MCGIRIENRFVPTSAANSSGKVGYDENKEEDEAESHVYANHQILIKEAISSEE